MTEPEHVPHNYPELSPVLSVRGGVEAIDFYQHVFGASVRLRLDAPDGRVNYAELSIGGALIMLAEETPHGALSSPSTLGGTSVRISLYVDDVDGVFLRAISAGAESIAGIKDEFYGDRTGQFRDPFGHCWSVATHIEDVSRDEILRRSKQATS